jgi:Ca2+-binding RTX toxin-like protein
MFALILSIMAVGVVLNFVLEDDDPASDDLSGDDSGAGGGGGGDDGGGGEETPSLPVATQGADELTLPKSATGKFDALGGDDVLTVEAETGASINFETRSLKSYFWETDDGEAPLVIDGGEGNDRLLLSGTGYEVTGGEGDDLIDLGDATRVIVRADGADTVLAGTGGAIVNLTETASFVGSDGEDNVVSRSSGTITTGGGDDAIFGFGQVDMGEGDDWFFGEDGASSVVGGAGNDTLIGTRSDSVFLPSATDLLDFYTSVDPDTLDGGVGNDTIGASHGDLVTSGTGADFIDVYLDADPDLSGVEITDFDPTQDRLIITHDFFGRDGALPDCDPIPFTGEVSVTETPEGDTIITGRDGQVLATLRGVTGLSIGADIDELTDLDGNPTPDAQYDVILTRFFNVTS